MFDIEKLGTRTNFESTARHGLKKFSFLESSFFVSLSDYKSIKKESAGTWSTINTKRKIAKLFIQTKCSWQVLSNLTFHWWSAIFKYGVRLVMLFFIVCFPVVFTNSWRAKTEKKNPRWVAIWNPTRVGRSLEKELILALMTKLQQVSNKLWKWNVQESFCVNSVCSICLVFFFCSSQLGLC